MPNVQIEMLPENFAVIYMQKPVSLPENIKLLIDNHWNSLIESGKKYRRGDSFTITNIIKSNSKTEIQMHITDYAHYLYTLHHNIDAKFACRILFTSILVETSDENFVIGEMATHTSTPGRLQCAGGGIDSDDLIGNVLNISGNMKKELYEELGINCDDKSIVLTNEAKYLKSGGDNDFLAVIYKVKLKIDSTQFSEIYQHYKEKLLQEGSLPEFDSLVFIPANPEGVRHFSLIDQRPRVDYLIPLLEVETGLR